MGLVWRRLCVAIFCCCWPVPLSEGCSFLQKKIAEKQQQRQQQSSDTGIAITQSVDGRTSEQDEGHSLPASYHQRRTQSACGGDFCYGRLTSLPAFTLDWWTLIAIASPSQRLEIGYMEDSSGRHGQLGGFDLTNRGATSAAGYTYLGQFLSHDLNEDGTSTLGVPVDPATLPNFNTPAVDLDTLYSHNGCSPVISDDKFIVNDRDFERDGGSGAALICDPRNDQHRIVSQITVAWMTLHNKFVDDLGFTFDEARDATIREWQAVVLTDLLPHLLDTEVLSAVAGGDRVLYVGDAYNDQLMPAEFSTAAYRLFHSRARTDYRLNGETFFRVFDIGRDEGNLVGGSPLGADMVIEWDRFFGTGAGTERARILDTLYARPIMRLPFGEAGLPVGAETIVECEDNTCPISVDEPEVDGVVKGNLALLDLLRGQTHSLPGGIAYAEHVASLGVDLDVLSISDMENNAFGLPIELPAGTATDVPLLFYLAFESVRDSSGQVLGQLGSRIVAEVIYGLVETASPSILADSSFTSEITGLSTVSMREVFDYIGWA